MEIVFERCAGIDVHKRTAVACRLTTAADGRRVAETRTFATTTDDLLRLSDWLSAGGCTHVGLESTDVFWRPILNILEESFEVWLLNAEHLKAVPGRKTHVRDAEWIADLLRHGLVRPSFIPPQHQRELRELTRHRTNFVRERATLVNRVQKVLEDANLKLAGVATDIMLAELLAQIDSLEETIARFDAQIQRACLANDEEDIVGLLDTIPGIWRATAELLVAEIGTDAGWFPSAAHLAAWTGLAPGNNESGERQRSGRTRKGNRWLRAALVQAAQAAARIKQTFLAAQYHRVAARRGKKKAIVVVAHSLLVIAYHIIIIARCEPYRELGADYVDRQRPIAAANRLVKRLRGLGYEVQLGEP